MIHYIIIHIDSVLVCNQKPHSHVLFGESGYGNFTKNATDSAKCIEDIRPSIVNCLASIQVKPGSVFSIADYGCADAGTSMHLMYACVKELRQLYGEKLEICIQFEDQPINYFKSLFLLLHG